LKDYSPWMKKCPHPDQQPTWMCLCSKSIVIAKLPSQQML
jgi:hypothetical protein